MILATSGSDVLVAAFSAVTAFLTIGFPILWRARKDARQAREEAAHVRRTLGEKNGNGNVVEMLEKSLDQVRELKVAQQLFADTLNTHVHLFATHVSQDLAIQEELRVGQQQLTDGQERICDLIGEQNDPGSVAT